MNLRVACLLFGFGLWLGLAPAIHAQIYEPYEITTIAGTNVAGSDDGIGNEARFSFPIDLTVDSVGSVFVTEYWGSRIRKIAQEGTNWIVTTLSCTYSDAPLSQPNGLAVDGEGVLYVTDGYNPNRIRKVAPIGTNWVITTLAGSQIGSTDGTNTDAKFSNPNAIAVGTTGNLYVSDTGNHTIRKLTLAETNWVTTTIAGMAGQAGHADGTNSDARFNLPAGIVVEGDGSLYVADSWNSTIRKIVPTGTNWVVTTIAGRAQTGTNGLPMGGYADGVGTQARFNAPDGLVLDHEGNLLVTDSGNAALRKVTPQGTNWVVTTLAGGPASYGTNDPIYNPGPGYADGIGAQAIIWSPAGIGVAPNGQVFFTELGNLRVRMGQMVPMLKCVPSAAGPVISWPSDAVGYVLETSSSPTAVGPWTPLTNGIVLAGNSYFLTNDISAEAAFFRLRK